MKWSARIASAMALWVNEHYATATTLFGTETIQSLLRSALDAMTPCGSEAHVHTVSVGTFIPTLTSCKSNGKHFCAGLVAKFQTLGDFELLLTEQAKQTCAIIRFDGGRGMLMGLAD